MNIRLFPKVVGIGLLCSPMAFAQTPEPKQKVPNEAEVILQDSKK
jgi:hypothetical protein